jgi:MFS family permease
MDAPREAERSWYSEVTRYQWIVLTIACLGWIFDVFEGQIFTVFKTPAMAEVLSTGEQGLSAEELDAQIGMYSDICFASFLIGGALGGLFFGMLADRIGRRQAMVWSILTYSLFSGLHFFATTWWHIAALRFLVAMGVGGEWAVAAALVAEVFSGKARTVAGGIFHASAVLGVLLAAFVGIFLTQASDWRIAFLLGVVPAILVFWILASLKESEKWQESRRQAAAAESGRGGLGELLSDPRWRKRAFIGFGLAAIGLGTYWGIYAWAPELMADVLGDEVSAEERRRQGSIAYMIMNLAGGLVGQLLFAPITMRFGRRAAFAFYHLGAAIIVPVTFLMASTWTQTVVLLTITAFFVAGMHAGYAIYFPEMFPTRLRATGASFCFNLGRLGSAIMLVVRGLLRSHLAPRHAVTVMSLFFVLGLVLLWFAPETKGEELPE